MTIAAGFEKKWQFPLCIGALDGKHIAFTPSSKNANFFFNYKGFHSIILLAIADAHAKFLFVEAGFNGRLSDGGALQRSDFMHILEFPEKYLPPRKSIGNNRTLPYVFVGDNAFPLMPNLMTPFPYSTMDGSKQLFNYSLSRSRQCIERAFGLMSNRFQILQKRIRLDETKTRKIVLACCVLHNFLVENSNWYSDEGHAASPAAEGTSENFEPTGKKTRNLRESDGIRKSFKDFFNNEGKIKFNQV